MKMMNNFIICKILTKMQNKPPSKKKKIGEKPKPDEDDE
jgi:hypothetical protein